MDPFDDFKSFQLPDCTTYSGVGFLGDLFNRVVLQMGGTVFHGVLANHVENSPVGVVHVIPVSGNVEFYGLVHVVFVFEVCVVC